MRDLRHNPFERGDPGVCFIAAAVIGGVASVASAGIQSSAASKASKAATDAATANNALEKSIYDSNVGLAQPTISRGNQAGDLLSNFLGLSGDPAKAQAALQSYLGSTGYQFQFDQGENAVTQNKAVNGSLDSGGTLKALTQYGQNIGSLTTGSYLDRLTNLVNSGNSAISSVSGQGQSYAGAVSNNNNSAADATGNAALSSASNTSSVINNLAGAYFTSKGKSSYGGGSGASPTSMDTLLNQIQNINTNVGG